MGSFYARSFIKFCSLTQYNINVALQNNKTVYQHQRSALQGSSMAVLTKVRNGLPTKDFCIVLVVKDED